MITIIATPLIALGNIAFNKLDIASKETLKEEDAFFRFQFLVDDFIGTFIFHDKLIEENVELSHMISGGDYMESTKVLGGKEGWLFYKAETDGISILDYQGLHHLSIEDCENHLAILTLTRDYLRDRGMDFIAVSAPNKELVYSEYMPDTIKVVNNVSRGQAFCDYVTSNSDIKFIYPRAAINAAKDFHEVYYRLDSHWNYIGANVALQEILKAAYGKSDNPLREELYTLKPEDFEGDLAAMSKSTKVYGLCDFYEINSEACDKTICSDKIVFFIGDSFTENLEIVAKPYFKQVYRVHIDDFTLDMLEEAKPDLVVYEAGERLLENIADKNIFK